MKFGNTLYQRSVPEWAINNIDYNEIKRSIKIHTSYDEPRPLVIPNGKNKAKEAQQLEDSLYTELDDQHDRVNDFVQVKAGELYRRLTALDKQVSRLGAEGASRGAIGLSVKRAEKFSRLDADIQRAGNEINSLSRFTQANSLGIKKLLKKYRRWTGSRVLEQRFCNNVLDKDSSFSKCNFEILFAQYAETLEAIRTAHARASQQRTSNASCSIRSIPSNQPQATGSIGLWRSAAALHEACEKGASVQFDASLALTPLGSGATRAAYWVHQDNIMNVQILLLQHMSHRKLDDGLSSRADTTPRISSPGESATSSPTKDYKLEAENYGLIICDELQRFAKCRSSETISDIEKSPGKALEKAVASITLSRSEDALIAIDPAGGENIVKAARAPGDKYLVKMANKKAVRNLFRFTNAEAVRTPSNDGHLEIKEWLSAHPEIKPLVKISGHRSRFSGLANSPKGGLWATLDKNIRMRRCSLEEIGADKSMLNLAKTNREGDQQFPHAILEVRVEGNGSVTLLRALDESHLAERVRGFSIETHAVATLCRPNAMPPPYWIPALERDIRKVPNLSTFSHERRSRNRISSEQASTAHTSLSAPSTGDIPSSSGFSAVHGESSATSAPEASGVLEASPLSPCKKKRKVPKRQAPIRKGSQDRRQPAHRRYWNEFDDGSEGEQHEAYTIYIDPNASSTFPGAAMVSKLWEGIGLKSKAPRQKITGWFRTSAAIDTENEPLTNSVRSSPEDSGLSDEENLTLPGRRHYSTFPTHVRRKHDPTREVVLFRSCISSFAASYILLLVAVILLSTGRRKAATEVDAGVVIGVSAALVFAVIGVGSMFARRKELGWVHRTTVLLLSLCVFLVGVALLVAMNHPSQ